jgi:FlaA1/EpsC-like NDP-sugar epimerase
MTTGPALKPSRGARLLRERLPLAAKRPVAVLTDAALLSLATWLAYALRFESLHWPSGDQWWVFAIALVFALPIFSYFGLYRAIFRHSGLPALVAVCRAVALYGMLFALLLMTLRLSDVPRSLAILQPMLALLLVGGWRFVVRVWFMGSGHGTRAAAHPVLIYGAGAAGTRLLAALQNSHELRVVGFIDDDSSFYGKLINGVPIYGLAAVSRLAERHGVAEVLLAIPSLARARRNEILEELRALGVHVRTLPGLRELSRRGHVQATDVRELDIEDLLGRDPVKPQLVLMARHTAGKVLLITGAGGSIGSELCRQVCAFQPHRLVLLDHSEYALYSIHHELKTRITEQSLPPCELVAALCSVRDVSRMSEVMLSHRPHIVYHAAAYKHVPLVEENVVEGVANNVLGTRVTAEAAMRAGVAEFVLVSTDKAVRPTNVMGASKRLAELVLQALAGPSSKSPRLASADSASAGRSTRFSMVRFGNVLGSSGSVVPLFRQQIRNGGPVTVTHPDVTRYFMTIPEAAQLVVQAGAMAQGGEVFVLDMGAPVRIVELARRMVELSGLQIRDSSSPGGDIDIVFSGLRPGEKLYEELLTGDNPEQTEHPRIMKAREVRVPWAELRPALEALERELLAGDSERVLERLQGLVAGYQPSRAAYLDSGLGGFARLDADPPPHPPLYGRQT